MKLFSLDSPVMRFLTQCGDLIILNVLWLICCLPVVTIGASTTALYSCFLNRSTESSSVRRFFSAFKSNFRQSTVLLLIEAIGLLLVYVNIRFYLSYLSDISIVLQVVSMIPCMLILTVSGYLFPLQAHFANTIKQTLKNAVLICIAHFPISLLITVLNLLPILIILIDVEVFLKISILFVLMGGAAIAYVNSFLFQRVFRQYVPEEGIEEMDGYITNKADHTGGTATVRNKNLYDL